MTRRGHAQPEFDNQTEKDTLFSGVLPSGSDEIEKPPAQFVPPVDAQRAARVQAETDSREWDRLDKQAQSTMEKTRKDVGGTALAAEDIEKEAAAAARRQLTDSPKKRPKKDRRNLGAGGKRIADNDRRVQIEHGDYTA